MLAQRALHRAILTAVPRLQRPLLRKPPPSILAVPKAYLSSAPTKADPDNTKDDKVEKPKPVKVRR